MCDGESTRLAQMQHSSSLSLFSSSLQREREREGESWKIVIQLHLSFKQSSKMMKNKNRKNGSHHFAWDDYRVKLPYTSHETFSSCVDTRCFKTEKNIFIHVREIENTCMHVFLLEMLMQRSKSIIPLSNSGGNYFFPFFYIKEKRNLATLHKPWAL